MAEGEPVEGIEARESLQQTLAFADELLAGTVDLIELDDDDHPLIHGLGLPVRLWISMKICHRMTDSWRWTG